MGRGRERREKVSSIIFYRIPAGRERSMGRERNDEREARSSHKKPEELNWTIPES